MRRVHYIVIVSALALIAILYWGGNTVPPKKGGVAEPVAGGGSSHSVKPASFDSILSAARIELPAHATSEIKVLEDKLTTIGDSSQMVVVFNELAARWQEHKQVPVAAYYHLFAAKLENSEKKLTFAAQLFLDLARKASSETAQAWSGQMAAAGFRQILDINPNNDTAKVNLAECYIGTGETMQGVLLLTELTRKDPDNVAANLILGQQGILSGQFDKSIGRFERVLKKEPKNIEGMLGLAEAYKGKGDKDKAVALLEQAKGVMNNPEFSKDIDQYIKSFK